MRRLLRAVRLVAIDTTAALCEAVAEQLAAERDRLAPPAPAPARAAVSVPSRPALMVVDDRAAAMRRHPAGRGLQR